MSGRVKKAGILIVAFLILLLKACVPPPLQPTEVELSASSTSITAGESVTLDWNATNVGDFEGKAFCQLFEDPQGPIPPQEFSSACSGSASRQPNVDTRYTFRALKPGRTPSSEEDFAITEVTVLVANAGTPNFENLTPTSLNLSASLDNSDTGSFSFDNTGTAVLTYTVTSSSPAVTVSPESGALTPNGNLNTTATETITVTGQCGSTAQTIDATVDITTTDATDGSGSVGVQLNCTDPSTPTLAVSVDPASISIGQGQSDTVAVTVTKTNFTSPVTLSLTGLPTGVTGTFSANPVARGELEPQQASTLTLDVGSSVNPDTYTVTITATDTDLTDTATLDLEVTAPPPATISITPTSVTVTSGDPAQTFTATTSNCSETPTWTLSGTAGGNIAPTTGATTSYTPPASGSGTDTLTATACSVSTNATVTVIQAPATIDTVSIQGYGASTRFVRCGSRWRSPEPT